MPEACLLNFGDAKVASSTWYFVRSSIKRYLGSKQVNISCFKFVTCSAVFCALPQVLVLLDVTPDQTMVDEGVAREVINRIQKLRKKVGK